MMLIWIILSFAVMPIFSVPDVKIELVTSTANETHTDYYDGEEVTIRCTATGFTNIGILRLRKEENSGAPLLVSCNLEDVGWEATTTPLATSLLLTSIAASDCEPTATGTSVIEPSGSNASTLKDVKFYCYAQEYDRSVEMNSPTNSISVIKDAPETLTMNIPTIIEDKEFTFNCSSTGPVPTSVYEYSITRSVGGVPLAPSNTYTPQQEDRGGITLKCRDIEHALWTAQSVIYKENTTKPHYIEGNEVVKSVEFHPKAEKYIIECNVTGYPTITYVWTCDNCPWYEDNGNILTLRAGATNGDTSNITCNATVPGVGSRTQGWVVQWTYNATTTTTPPEPGPKPVPWWVWLIVAIVVAIIIGALVYFCYYKKKAVNSTTNKQKYKNGTDPASVDMTEC